ncbi:MAG TPA: Maf family protein [Acidisarcina sp.]
MLVLASASPRRRELLSQAGFVFDVIASEVPEERGASEGAIPFCARLAREKAESVFGAHRERLDRTDKSAKDPLVVIGADTIVVAGPAAGSEILGKPVDAVDAARMLGLLAGGTHQVMTGVAVVSRVAAEVAVEVTYVTMLTPSEAEIAAYVAGGEPMGKAGAYAIQGYAARWIPRVQGCYFNVVGLPLARTSSMVEGMYRRLRLEDAAARNASTAQGVVHE